MINEPWSQPHLLAELVRAPRSITMEADAEVRARIAKVLKLVSLDSFSADLRTRPWFDGVEISGPWRATYVQICGITLDPFETRQEETLLLRCVPPGSPRLPSEEDEAEFDPEAEDPPDLAENGVIDLGHYLVEQLALAIDPFPRKPGAVFEPPEETKPESPFAVLARLKPQGE